MCLFCFFSSRRRHTRCLSDWSSDVCSSDLYMWNAVYLNTGTDRFQEIAHLIGVDATGWTWAARMADLDCSGREDLFFTAGMIRNFTNPDLVDKQNVAPNLNARAQVWKNSPVRRSEEHTSELQSLR